MKKLFIILILLSVQLHAQTNYKKSLTSYLGFGTLGAPSVSAVTANALNAAPTGASGKQNAFSFIPDATKTINLVRIRIHSIVGSLAATDVSLEIQADDGSGHPSGTSLGSTTTVSPALAALTWSEFSGLSVSLTGGRQYWAVIKNNNGTPASNYPQIRAPQANLQSLMSLGGVGTNVYSWGISTTADGGTTWSHSSQSGGVFRIGYSDGSYDGIPIQSAGADTTNKIYSTNYNGLKLTLPGTSSLSYNIVGLAMIITKTGSPAGSVVLNLYNNTTLLASTLSLSVSGQTTGNWVWGYFSATQSVAGGTVLRIVASDSAADSSSAAYEVYQVVWDSDASSTPLIPLGGNIVQTYYNGSSWADGVSVSGGSATTIVPALLILDPDTPVVAGGASASGLVF